MPVALDVMMQVDNSSVPALHPSRIEKMLFVRYSSPPVNLEDRGSYDMWLESVNYLCDDFHWLLQQPHDKFWCQVVFDESLNKALDSFLCYCPRSQEVVNALPTGGRQKQVELCRLIFMTFLRMATHKESKDCFITPSVFGEILYENFLFDIPKILDICALFGNNNKPLLSKMITNIFTQQPKYTDDLRQTVPTIIQVFTNIALQCGVKMDCSSMSPQKLEDKPFNANATTMKIDQVQDLVIYLDDIATTLLRFLEVYPEGCQVFCEAHFQSVLATFYEGVIPLVTDNARQTDHGSSVEKKKNLVHLHHCKKALLTIFHVIINQMCLQPVLENATNEILVNSSIEEFLHMMTSVLNERRFLAAYEGVFVFQDDVDLLLQASSCVDASQFEYIQSAINSAFATFGRRKSPRGDTNTGGRTSPDGAADAGATASAQGNKPYSSTMVSSYGQGARPKTVQATGGTDTNSAISEAKKDSQASRGQPSEVEMESLIFAVKDILPHLGDGFIEAALEELDYDQERVISSVLEDSLPLALRGKCFDMPRQERAVNQGDGATDATSLVDSRRNVFDHDQFDVFHNKNVKEDHIHQGKMEKNVELQDKSIAEIVKANYSSYGSWEKNDSAEGDNTYETDLMYDDEYDDTYDTTNVGADDADSADELSNKTMPRVLVDLERKKAKMEGRLVSESDESEDDDEQDQAAKRDDFVQDPAKLREQAAQRRQTQTNRGRKGPPRNFDVKGGAKGQGQSKEVVNNRRSKEKFKGQRNRANADKKMSKGMF